MRITCENGAKYTQTQKENVWMSRNISFYWKYSNRAGTAESPKNWDEMKHIKPIKWSTEKDEWPEVVVGELLQRVRLYPLWTLHQRHVWNPDRLLTLVWCHGNQSLKANKSERKPDRARKWERVESHKRMIIFRCSTCLLPQYQVMVWWRWAAHRHSLRGNLLSVWFCRWFHEPSLMSWPARPYPDPELSGHLWWSSGTLSHRWLIIQKHKTFMTNLTGEISLVNQLHHSRV